MNSTNQPRTVRLYLTHPSAPQFCTRMATLAHSLCLSEFKIDFDDWRSKMEFENDFDLAIACVQRADLTVIIMDHPSDLHAVIVHERCIVAKPLLCFVPAGQQPPKTIIECFDSHHRSHKKARNEHVLEFLPYPLSYDSDDEIISAIINWIFDLEEADTEAKRRGLDNHQFFLRDIKLAGRAVSA